MYEGKKFQACLCWALKKSKWNLGINGPLEFATYRIQSDELKIKFREWQRHNHVVIDWKMEDEEVKIISIEKLWKRREIISWNGLWVMETFIFKIGDRILWVYAFLFDFKNFSILSILLLDFSFNYPEEIRWFLNACLHKLYV